MGVRGARRAERRLAGADARARRSARLEGMDFVPPAQWEQALLLLESEPCAALWQRDGGYEMFRAREVALGKEVEQFAADFFSIPPAQRQERWRELTAACAFSRPLAVWLQALSGGLSVVPPQLQDTGRLRELADYVCRNFTKRPTARIAVDEVLLRHAAYAPKEWQDAALRLRQSYAQIAGLAPHLVAHLSEYVSFCKKEEKAEEKRKRASAKAAWTFPQLSGSRNYVWLIWVVVMVLSGVLRREFRQ